MRLGELQEYLKGMHFFGEMKFYITEKDNEKVISVIDQEQYQVVSALGGEEVEEGTNHFSRLLKMQMYLNKDNKVVLIEHGYGAFTVSNKDEAILVANLVGKEIEL